MKSPEQWASLIQQVLDDNQSLSQEFYALTSLVIQIQEDCLESAANIAASHKGKAAAKRSRSSLHGLTP